jgi:hypothetical protein
MSARRKALCAGDRRRKPTALGRLGRLTRSAVLQGALIAVSIFIRIHAAARFDGFFHCTAKPYVSLMRRIAARHRKFAHR